jgi:hypothetical protein
MNFKSRLKSLSYWTLPPGIKDILISLYSKPVGNNDFDLEQTVLKELVAENSKFKNIHHGERCFILATGPSIKTQDLRYLQGELCIGVSQFFLHKDIKIISPKYHVLAPSHHPFNFDDLNKIFDGLMQSYSDGVTCFLGYTPYIYSPNSEAVFNQTTGLVSNNWTGIFTTQVGLSFHIK